MGPARNYTESLTPDPELENSQGQSRRFNDVRASSALPMILALIADISLPPSWAMCGRLRVVKGLITSQRWSEQPCVRPISAAHLAAGHNALRGSGPGQNPAFEDALARVGCPDHRIDRFCITCCQPFPTISSRRYRRDLVNVASPYRASATGSR